MTATFYFLAVGLVVTALAVLVSRDLVHAAIAMVAHFGLTAALYVLLVAPFVAAVQLILYAGAIMVLFLFVVMIVGDRQSLPSVPDMGRARLLAALGLVVLGGVLVAVVWAGVPAAPAGGAAQLPDAFGSPGSLGALLLREHVLELETVSVLLLVAMVGAVALSRHGGPANPPGAPEGEQQ
jgi:NADH-quinone oxidoreductase subunit J